MYVFVCVRARTRARALAFDVLRAYVILRSEIGRLDETSAAARDIDVGRDVVVIRGNPLRGSDDRRSTTIRSEARKSSNHVSSHAPCQRSTGTELRKWCLELRLRGDINRQVSRDVKCTACIRK